MTSKEALAIGTDTKPPVLFRGEYEQWKDRFLNFIERQDLGNFIIQSLEEGLMETKYREPAAGTQEERVALSYTDLTGDAKLRAKGDRLAKSYILQGITNEIYVKIDNYKASAKQMWDQLEKMMLGSKIGNQLKISICLHSFEEFKGRTGETLEGTYDRFVTLLNELSKNKVNKSQIELNIKFLSILQPEWKSFARQMRQIKDLNEIPLHEVYETLRQNEDEVDEILAEKRKGKTVEDTVALVVKKKKKNKTIVYESEEAEADVVSDSDENEQMQQAMQFLTNAFQKKLYRNPTSNSQRYSSGPNNYAHKERIEGSRYEGKRSEGKRFEGRRSEERKPEERRFQSEGKRIEERRPEERKFKAEGSS
ncbi:hypothetical protein L6452_36170 [Arctium lappa]|uniref:Uncharacterized protein n=1 Tax=Arctium lappa TaxID=4217 RepID=A0ACB8Y9B0_ARCLA|nr:hypothetical protein L6452_36170 [Arctium lappa]